jgi:hypothetical protein
MRASKRNIFAGLILAISCAFAGNFPAPVFAAETTQSGSGGDLATKQKAYQAWQALDHSVAGLDCDASCKSVAPILSAPPGTWALTDLGESDDDNSLGPVLVALVQQEGGAFHVVATGKAPGPKSVGGNDSAATIDGAAYPVSKTHVVFGVRVYEGYSLQAGYSDHETLYLFLQSGSSLTPIFDTVVVDSGGDPTSSGSSGSWNDQWIVRISAHAENGFYDLIVSKKSKRQSIVYRWDGKKYQRVSDS